MKALLITFSVLVALNSYAYNEHGGHEDGTFSTDETRDGGVGQTFKGARKTMSYDSLPDDKYFFKTVTGKNVENLHSEVDPYIVLDNGTTIDLNESKQDSVYLIKNIGFFLPGTLGFVGSKIKSGTGTVLSVNLFRDEQGQLIEPVIPAPPQRSDHFCAAHSSENNRQVERVGSFSKTVTMKGKLGQTIFKSSFDGLRYDSNDKVNLKIHNKKFKNIILSECKDEAQKLREANSDQNVFYACGNGSRVLAEGLVGGSGLIDPKYPLNNPTFRSDESINYYLYKVTLGENNNNHIKEVCSSLRSCRKQTDETAWIDEKLNKLGCDQL